MSVILEIEWGLLPGTGFVLPLLVFSLWGMLEQGMATRTGREPSVAHEV